MRAILSMLRRAGSMIAPFVRILAAVSGRSVLGLVFAGVVSALMAASPGPRGVASAEVRDPRGVAVIVGNTNYKEASEVKYAHRDAAAFRQYVVEVLGYDPKNIIEVKDADQATMESVFGNERSHEGLLWQYLNPRGSDVVVFYSGHGVPSLKDKRSYLLPVNAHPDTPEINGYPLGLLYRNLSALDLARSIRVFVDACFSGGSGDGGMLIRSASPLNVMPKEELPADMGRLTVLTAASREQVASWDDDMQHGLFTHHLLDALYGNGDKDRNGEVTVGEVKNYLDYHMTYAARRTYGRRQVATVAGDANVVLAATAPGRSIPPRPMLDPTATAGASPKETKPPSAPSPRQSRKDGATNEIEGRILLTGAVQAHARGDYPAVLNYVTQLDKLGVSVPSRLEYFRGVALFHTGRVGEAGAALRRYMDAAGADAQYSEESLVLLVKVKQSDDAAFAKVRKADTLKAYQEYLKAYPNAYHLEDARGRMGELDREAFLRAQSQDTLASYQDYLTAFPEGGHVAEARVRMRELDADNKAFARAESDGTVAAFQAYIDAYPQGKHAPAAERRRDDLVAAATDHAAFEEARKRDTVVAYAAYLSAHRNGKYRTQAQQRIAVLQDDAAFAAAETKGTAAAYDAYLKAHTHGRHAGTAKRQRDSLRASVADNAAYASARSRDTAAAYQEYLIGHPRGAHVQEATARKKKLELDDAAFARTEAADTAEGYLEYVEAHPQGRYVVEAKRRREGLLKKAADDAAFVRTQDTVEAYKEYLRQYPNGIHAPEVRRRMEALVADHQAFDSARAADTPASYDEYLAAHPNGRHVDEVRRLRTAAVEREAIAVEKRVSMRPLEKVQIEQSLASAGMDVGTVDGKFTRRTRAALRSWQAARGVEQSGYLTQDQADALMRDGKEFKDCRGCPEMVFVPAGSFTMGSQDAGETEQPEHRVSIPAPLAVGKYEVTFAEWDACVRYGGCEGHRPSDYDWGRGGRPVVEVTWGQAKKYAEWLSRRTGREYRLLSESEWEYVARAGATTDYWWGDEIGTGRANCDGCGSRWDDEKTAPVGSFAANAFGLYDVHGNVWEWVEDCWKDNYHGVPSDGTAWQPPSYETCAAHVIRGGSWNEWPGALRVGLRNYDNLTGFSFIQRHDQIGFRVARSLTR